MPSRPRGFVPTLLLLVLLPAGLISAAHAAPPELPLAGLRGREAAQPPKRDTGLGEYIRANYVKAEYQVPMRDGVKLHTAVYAPKDTTQTYPILLMRTPYSCAPYGEDKYPGNLAPGEPFVKSGYIFVYQDVRGRWNSEGEFVNMRPINPAKKTPQDVDESSDTFDTIDWLLKNVKGNSGKVGQWGVSYPGFYTVCGMIDAHPALKAASPQAPVTDWFVGDDWHHNGALFLPHAFNFLAGFGRPRPEPTTQPTGRPFNFGTPDGYKFFLETGPLANIDRKYFKGDVAFWNEMMQHDTYDDWWKARNVRQHVKNIKPAVLTVGGWFDAENLFGALETFKHAEANNPPAEGNHLVMGPWVHGGWHRTDGDRLGDVSFGGKSAEFYRERVEFPFFEAHLKGKGEDKLPKATVFETGVNRWRQLGAWPPAGNPRAMVFHPGGQLAVAAAAGGRGSFDEFVSDPAKPVPFVNRPVTAMVQDYMDADQRFAATRPDVLVYQTDPLTEDLTVAGPIEVELFVSTTGTDADWVVKVIDVYPDDTPDPSPNPTGVRMGGYQQLVRGDVMRGKFRNSFEKPEPFKPGVITQVRFNLQDVLHTFRPGHRVMVQVQSSWFPLVDRNPQTFCDINTCSEDAFRKQTHRVYHDPELPSRVTFRVIK